MGEKMDKMDKNKQTKNGAVTVCVVLSGASC